MADSTKRGLGTEAQSVNGGNPVPWWLILAVTLIAGLLATFYGLNAYTSATATLIKAANANADHFETTYEDAAEYRINKLRFGADVLLHNKEVIGAFIKGDREALLERTVPLYEKVLQKKHDVDRFNFWTPPATLFLRAHEPKAFGIDLSSFRQILVAASTNQVDVSGMEVGAGGAIALRAVAPVMDGTRLAGVIELGSELDSLLKRASKTSGLDYAVGLDLKQAEAVKKPLDAKNDAKQGEDVFYKFSSPAIGDLMRRISFDPRHKEHQIVHAGKDAIFVHTFAINDFSGQPTVVVATLTNLGDEFAGALQTVVIQSGIAFLVLFLPSLIALFKFRDLRDGFTRTFMQQRLELEEKAAFCEAAAEKLKDVDLLRRGFFTNLITAINEPLKAVAGTLKTTIGQMESAGASGGQLEDRMRFSLSETERLSSLIEDYQQIEFFRQHLVSSDTDLLSPAEVVRQTMETDLTLVRRLPQLSILAEVPASLPRIRVNGDLMRRALSALVIFAARGAGQGRIVLQGGVNAQGWLKLSISGSAFELAGAPTEALLDEARQFLMRLATEQGPIKAGDTLIPIVLARMIVEFYGGRIDASPPDMAHPGFVILLPSAA